VRPISGIPHIDMVGDTNTGAHYEDGRPAFPVRVMSADLGSDPRYPRTVMPVLSVLEKDRGGDLLNQLNVMDEKYRAEIIKLVAKKGQEALGAAATAIAGPVAASQASSVAGGVVDALAGALVNGLFDAIKSGLSDEVLAPMTFSMTMPLAWFDFANNDSVTPQVSSGVQAMDYWGGNGDAHYQVLYEWRINRSVSPRRPWLQPVRPFRPVFP
jgi:hypothetical protein